MSGQSGQDKYNDLWFIGNLNLTIILSPPSATFDEALDWPDDDDVIIDIGCFVFFKMNVCSRLFYMVNPHEKISNMTTIIFPQIQS